VLKSLICVIDEAESSLGYTMRFSSDSSGRSCNITILESVTSFLFLPVHLCVMLVLYVIQGVSKLFRQNSRMSCPKHNLEIYRINIRPQTLCFRGTVQKIFNQIL